jgi:hypothetical protein
VITDVFGSYTCIICYLESHVERQREPPIAFFVELAWVLLPPGALDAIACDAHEPELAATLLRMEEWESTRDIPEELRRAVAKARLLKDSTE